jgi:hypothetical protein
VWIARATPISISRDTSTDFGTIPNDDDRFIEVDENSEPATMKSNRMLWSARYTTVARDAVNPLLLISRDARRRRRTRHAIARAGAASASLALTVPKRRVHNPHLLHSSRFFGVIESRESKRETDFSA